MHLSSMQRVRWFEQTYARAAGKHPQSVLDVGCCGAGATYRDIFGGEGYSYTGIDVIPGPNVDIVLEHPYNYGVFADGSFDVVLSGQAFEHMEFFWFAAAEMARVLAPGGLLCIVAPWGYATHRHPVDTYRFNCDGMIAVARYAALEPLHASTHMQPAGRPEGWAVDAQLADSMLVARKPPDWKGCVDPKTYRYAAADVAELSRGFAEIPATGAVLALYPVSLSRERAAPDRQSGGRGHVIFGAGAMGKKVCADLERAGMRVPAFCDNHPSRKGTVVQGRPVFEPAEALRRYPGAAVVVATQFGEFLRDMLRELAGHGVDSCFAAVEHKSGLLDALLLRSRNDPDVLGGATAGMPTLLWHNEDDGNFVYKESVRKSDNDA